MEHRIGTDPKTIVLPSAAFLLLERTVKTDMAWAYKSVSKSSFMFLNVLYKLEEIHVFTTNSSEHVSYYKGNTDAQ